MCPALYFSSSLPICHLKSWPRVAPSILPNRPPPLHIVPSPSLAPRRASLVDLEPGFLVSSAGYKKGQVEMLACRRADVECIFDLLVLRRVKGALLVHQCGKVCLDRAQRTQATIVHSCCHVTGWLSYARAEPGLQSLPTLAHIAPFLRSTIAAPVPHTHTQVHAVKFQGLAAAGSPCPA